jgi:hypothetical protein
VLASNIIDLIAYWISKWLHIRLLPAPSRLHLNTRVSTSQLTKLTNWLIIFRTLFSQSSLSCKHLSNNTFPWYVLYNVLLTEYMYICSVYLGLCIHASDPHSNYVIYRYSELERKEQKVKTEEGHTLLNLLALSKDRQLS